MERSAGPSPTSLAKDSRSTAGARHRDAGAPRLSHDGAAIAILLLDARAVLATREICAQHSHVISAENALGQRASGAVN